MNAKYPLLASCLAASLTAGVAAVIVRSTRPAEVAAAAPGLWVPPVLSDLVVLEGDVAGPDEPPGIAPTGSGILDLQPFRVSRSVTVPGVGKVTITNLNPNLGIWHLLEVAAPDGPRFYHLQAMSVGGSGSPPASSSSVLVGLAEGDAGACGSWEELLADLDRAGSSGRPHTAVCAGRLLAVNRVASRRSNLEWTADVLRDRVWGGERITSLVRETLFRDGFVETSELQEPADEDTASRPRAPGAPGPVRIAAAVRGLLMQPEHLAIPLRTREPGRVLAGRWYAPPTYPGVFVSTLQPRFVDPQVVADLGDRIHPLDEVEAAATSYLVAFDLEHFELGFALGTDHPRLGWSERVAEERRDPARPGPDGIADAWPLVRTGKLAPDRVGAVAATFAGGFERSHGAFRYGPLALSNDGHHYGFVEEGVVFSKLQPGLATVAVWDDGRVTLATWSVAEDRLLAHVRHARQNGVALLETDAESGEVRAGDRVRDGAQGNWSGSVDQKQRSLRSGLCLQESEDGRRFLVYGYFSTATPSAMSVVFAAAGCSHAMPLDMNDLEHTYLALYEHAEGALHTDHLIRGMEVLDQGEQGEERPRFIAVPDRREFFYLLRRES